MKSYFASSFQEAMKQAQQEMGPDALLLNSRETLPEARHLGDWEVVFGAPPESPKPVTAPPATAFTAALTAMPPQFAPRESVNGGEDLMHYLHDIQGLLRRLATAPPSLERRNDSGVVQALIEAGLEQELAVEIEESILHRLGKSAARNHDLLIAETARELADRIEIQPEVGKVTALVGPPGSGKTITLVKLAVSQGLLARRSVRLITTDVQRIGAVNQLRTYADILGVRFEAVETVEALAHAIDSGPAAALTLIDTPGFSNVPLAEADAALAVFLKERQDIDTHLVLTASMRSEDLKRTADRFEVFSPAKLLFTKVDETDSYGAIFREAARRHKPVSFFTDGLLIPENIKPASKEQVVDALVHHLPDALRLAA